MILYIGLHGGYCGLSTASRREILKAKGTDNVREIRPATETDVASVRAMGGYVPKGRIAKVQS